MSTPELYSLSKGQLRAVVDRVGLAAHVGFPGVGAGLPPAARFLLTAESPPDLRAARADVHIGNSAIAPGNGQEALRLQQIAR